MEQLLKMEGVSKEFPGVKALQNVRIELNRGELHALVGENGAGKSTLMKILSGVHQKDSGKILFKGKEVDINHPKVAQELGINIIYQEFNLFPDLSVAQNIFVTREPRNSSMKFVIDDAELMKKTKKILELVHLRVNPNTLVSELSVAQQQMVEIAKVLSMNSEIIIMDEPTAALTEEEVQELFNVIHELKKQGKGIIYISHRLEELEHIADRVTVLRDGQYIKTVDYKDTSIDGLIKAMVGRDLEDKFPKHEMSRGDLILKVNKMKREKELQIQNFELYEGEILGIYGLVGAGRTEFARALFGADKVDESEVFIRGKRVNIKNTQQAVELGFGYITEDRKKDGLALSLSVEHNINLANMKAMSKLSVVNFKQAIKNAQKYIADLKIKTPSLEQPVNFLSGGNQQKVVLAKWLCRNARIIIFDEPTRGIDVGAKTEVYEIMETLKKQGVGIIMISSELPEILGMSDRVVVMRDGKLTGELTREEATQEKILSYAVS